MVDREPEQAEPTVEEEKPPERVKFSAWLAEHRNGVFDADALDALDKVIDGVLMTGKAGTVTIEFKITKNGDMLQISDKIVDKTPEIIEPRLYWRDLDGNLTRDNPLAPRMEGM